MLSEAFVVSNTNYERNKENIIHIHQYTVVESLLLIHAGADLQNCLLSAPFHVQCSLIIIIIYNYFYSFGQLLFLPCACHSYWLGFSFILHTAQ